MAEWQEHPMYHCGAPSGYEAGLYLSLGWFDGWLLYYGCVVYSVRVLCAVARDPREAGPGLAAGAVFLLLALMFTTRWVLLGVAGYGVVALFVCDWAQLPLRFRIPVPPPRAEQPANAGHRADRSGVWGSPFAF